jgi:hypothetical protein
MHALYIAKQMQGSFVIFSSALYLNLYCRIVDNTLYVCDITIDTCKKLSQNFVEEE